MEFLFGAAMMMIGIRLINRTGKVTYLHKPVPNCFDEWCVISINEHKTNYCPHPHTVKNWLTKWDAPYA